MGVLDHQMCPETEAIIPVDVYMPTFWIEEVDWNQNVAQLRQAQDQSEER